MKSVLMVCLGNICRSPLAEGILRHKAEQLNIKIHIESAGTSNYHIGQVPDKRSISTAKKHGIDISKLRGRQFTVNDFETFDFIFVMDASNYSDVLMLAQNQFHKQKVDLILNKINPNKNQPVPDPYYGGEEGFENVFRLLDDACDVIIQALNDDKN